MSSILIVDDVDINRMILSEILHDDFDILEAENGVEAINILFNGEKLPEAVLLDIMMPLMDGFEVLEMMKSNPRTENLPVLFITAADSNTNESRGLRDGAADYISKPFNPDVVRARVDNHIQLKRYRDNLEQLVEQKTAALMANHERVLETLATIIEYRSLETGDHIRRTSELTKLLIHAMLRHDKYKDELSKQRYNSIIKAVALHDIGKVGIPDSVLLKPGALTKEEFEIIKSHSEIGARIIESIAKDAEDDEMYFQHCYDICLYHHERWDGKGYPKKLAGDDIPISARILSVVDVYDALVNKRCYKPALTHEETLEILESGSGTQFDPGIVSIVMEISDKFKALEDEMGDKNE